MTRNADRPDVQEDTDQWDWVPVEQRRDRHKAAGAIVLAASCLTLGLLAGVVWSPIFRGPNSTSNKTALSLSKNVDSAPKPPSEPSLALGGPSATTTKTQEGAPTAPVVINKGSANANQEPRADGGERTEATMKSLEAQATKSRDVTPKAAADPQTEAIRPKILKPEVRGSATPARPVERSFKDYRDLRNYALSK